MINNILAELRKSLGRKYTYMYFGGIILLILLANTAVIAFRLIYGANEGTYANNILEYATWCFVIPYYTCILIAGIGFGKEYPNPHIKDGHTSSLSKTEIYLSKLIVSLVLGAIFLIVAAIALLAITGIFQLGDGLANWYSISDFLIKMCIAMPLWYAGVSIGIMFLFLFEKRAVAVVSYLVLTLVIPRVIMFFAAEPFKIVFFRMIRTYTITQNFSLIPYPADPSRNVPLTIALGLIYGTLATIIGCISFNKKKFK